MATGVPAGQKANPADVAAQSLIGIETGAPEILADDITRYVKQSLATSPTTACSPLCPLSILSKDT